MVACKKWYRSHLHKPPNGVSGIEAPSSTARWKDMTNSQDINVCGGWGAPMNQFLHIQKPITDFVLGKGRS
jgi:hypothetical protein